MNLTPSKTLIAAAAVAGAGLLATTAQAEDREIVSLAHQLDRAATQMRQEADLHFRHTGGYRHLVADTNSLIRAVEHIDELAHAGYRVSYTHFEADLDKLDELVHHLHDVVDRIDEGDTGGHKHGSTAHVHRLMRSIENLTHELQEVVNDRYRHGDLQCAPRGNWWDRDVIERRVRGHFGVSSRGHDH